ncbi:MAG: hypothetical protein HXX16_00915 [Bacteroidales bacterium]|nr:hypothetical protein [Bacteroidales bacterium]
MAGICGIIQMNGEAENQKLKNAFEKMLPELSAELNPSKSQLVLDSIWVGKCFPKYQDKDNQPIYNHKLSIYYFVDGEVYVSDSIQKQIQEENRDGIFLSPSDYIPYLYVKFSVDFVKHLTGWFNIFLFDVNDSKCIIANDRLGFLPLFIYNSGNQFIFASKLECIIASGLMKNVDFDLVSFAEQYTFNYQLSDNSLIEGIKTLPVSSIYQIKREEVNKAYYWSPQELIVESPISRKEGFEIINEALDNAVNKALTNHLWNIAVTLTGGWDGRLVLSYALKQNRSRISLFSFGEKDSADILIPRAISKSEDLGYCPYILDEDYFDKFFIDSARNSIIKSNGIRGYRRAPYFFTTPQISTNSRLILSGNFGDEILKFATIKASEVISSALINYISSDFKIRPDFPQLLFKEQSVVSKLIEEWNIRLEGLEKEVSGYGTISEKYNHIKLSRIANRFFGYEVNSYNDYIPNFSPFLDIDFITAFSKTNYSGIYHPFNANRLKDKEIASRLYANLISRNNKRLASYKSDRGYSMADVINPFGRLLVLSKKHFLKQTFSDGSFVNGQSAKFFDAYYQEKYPETYEKNLQYPLKNNVEQINKNLLSRVQSLNYWISYITDKYLK